MIESQPEQVSSANFSEGWTCQAPVQVRNGLMRVAALIVAAGRGLRAGQGLPKQYRPVGGVPLLRRCLDVFALHPRIDRVLTVIHPDDQDLFEAASKDCPGLLPAVLGGDTRQASVLAGLEALQDISPTHVLIHDGARPFVSSALVDGIIDALATHKAVLPALRVNDTLRRSEEGLAGETVDRTNLVRAQTPQGFVYDAIVKAHRACADGQGLFTDDIAVAAAAGIKAGLVAGTEENFKVTEREDFDRAEKHLLAARETRSCLGFVVHRFCEGDHVMLCGVAVPHTHGLLGHSDADVALHAITDALLGAIGEGDIGVHFPPSDPQWKGVPSRTFLEHAVMLMKKKQGRISNIDLTLICEAPKILPYRDQFLKTVAEILGIAVERVSVKATTTEGLGFTGRSEGIAAQAIATVSVPAGGLTS